MSRFGVITRNGIVRSFIEGSQANLYDPDAQAFFTAASITDTTQKSAVNTLVLSLKSANIWTKMKALYPVVGGVASSHAVNLKTPGTYNLSFATGWTHSSTGMTPSNAYADTNLMPSTAGLGQNSTHFTYYSRTNINEGKYDMGISLSNYSIIASNSSNLFYAAINQAPQLSASNSDSRGLFMSNRTSSSNVVGFKNNIKLISSNTVSATPENYSFYIGSANRNNTPLTYSSKECAFASIGDGLTDAEASSFYTAVQNYQTTLGRQV